MANQIGALTLDQILMSEVDADPSIGGLSAPIGSIALLGTNVTAAMWLKTGATNTSWNLMPPAASGAALTQGSVAFADANGYMAQNNANFFWDNTNIRLNIGNPADTTGVLNISSTADVPIFTVQGSGISNAVAFSLETLPLSTTTANGKAFQIKVNGEGNGRSVFYSDGSYGIGPGSATRDLFISRAATSTLSISSDRASGAANLIINGNLGVGGITPTSDVHLDSGTATASYLKITAGTTTGTTAIDGFDVGISTTGAAELRQRENLNLSVFTNNTERLRVDSAGTVIVGSASPVDITGASVFPTFQIIGTSAVQMAAIQYSADTIPPVFNLLKSRGALNTQGLLSSGDELGRIQFRGSDGTNFIAGASIRAAVDNTAATNSMPGRIMLMTTPTGSVTPVNAITIDSTQIARFVNGITLGTLTDTTNGNVRFNGLDVEFYRNTWRSLTYPTIEFDDFNFVALGSGVNKYSVVAVVLNGGAGTVQGTVTGNNYTGLVQAATGTTLNATGVAALDFFNSTSRMIMGGLPFSIGWRVRIPVLSTATVGFQVRFGLQDTNTTGDPTNGIFFTYTHSLNTGSWTGVTRSASTSTTVNTTPVTVVAGTWYRCRAEVNAAGTQVDFYIDSGSGYVLIGSSTTNIPTTAMRPMAKNNKTTTTTTSSILDCDWCWWNQER